MDSYVDNRKKTAQSIQHTKQQQQQQQKLTNIIVLYLIFILNGLD